MTYFCEVVKYRSDFNDQWGALKVKTAVFAFRVTSTHVRCRQLKKTVLFSLAKATNHVLLTVTSLRVASLFVRVVDFKQSDRSTYNFDRLYRPPPLTLNVLSTLHRCRYEYRVRSIIARLKNKTLQRCHTDIGLAVSRSFQSNCIMFFLIRKRLTTFTNENNKRNDILNWSFGDRKLEIAMKNRVTDLVC